MFYKKDCLAVISCIAKVLVFWNFCKKVFDAKRKLNIFGCKDERRILGNGGMEDEDLWI